MTVTMPNRRRFRLRTTLVVPFLLQITVAVGLVGYFSFRNGQRAVNNVAQQLRQEVVARVQVHLNSYLAKPHLVQQIQINTLRQKLIDATNFEQMENYFWLQSQSLDPNIGTIAFANSQGEFVGANKPERYVVVSNAATDRTIRRYEVDEQGNRFKLIRERPNYDARTRDWYKTAVSVGRPTWSTIAPSALGKRLDLSAVSPFYDDTGILQGVFLTDISLAQISDFLHSFTVGKSGKTLIVERSGLLVASSVNKEPFTFLANGEIERVAAAKIDDKLTQSTANFLLKTFGDLHQIKTPQQLEFFIDGQKQFVQVSPFQDASQSLDWLVIVVVPESDFTAEIDANTRMSIFLCIGTLLGAIAISIFTARLITEPIMRLTKGSQELAAGNLDQQIETNDLIEIEEIDTLEHSFNSMATQLQASFATLEAQKATLADQNEELQHLDQLKNEFLANTSHELRTPLNGIIGIAESLIDGATGSLPLTTQVNLQLIVSSGRRLASLINDILDFSKLKQKNLELKLAPVDLRAITQTVLDLSEPLAYQKNLRLINAISKTLPNAEADENRLQQILYNLIGNALKFTPSGTIEISAEVIFSAEEKQVLAVTISDTGIGIAEDKFDLIFQSFEQAEGATAREYGGTGLGLAVTKQLVELHGGEIRIKSQLGVGSQFTFTLPISQEKTKSVLPPAAVRPMLSSELITLTPAQEITNLEIANLATDDQQFKILIVDDEPINRQVLINNLSLYNYTLTEASDGEEALAIIENGLIPDLILLDLMMPRMSGYEVCQKIRERFPAHELPIVILTAKDQQEDIVDGFSSGANDYLPKPVQKQEMLARMKTHLNLAKLTLAYGRFVPRDFLHFLGKESIIDVQIGNQIQQEMTVMFSDIRDFTSLSEAMTPQETFNFINDYLSRVSPAIRQHKGFIDKYIGDAIMALFPQSADEAVQAAVAMQQKVALYNQERIQKDLMPISIGIGLHTGKLMLGTIGEPERMETTVISDGVNLASRLEGLTKVYGAGILISVHTLVRVENIQNYSFRFLDRVRVKGKKDAVAIYELYDEATGLSNQLKTQSKSIFEAAVMAYNRQDFVGAQPVFADIVAANPEDKAAMLYVKRCQQYQQYGVPIGWDGVTDLDFK